MKIKWLVATFFALFMVCGQEAALGKRSSQPEQLHFSAEDSGVTKPVAIPDDVLAILRDDETVRLALKDESTPAEKLPLSWFSASAVHLSRSDKSDLVVKGEGPIAGANVTTFWIFNATDRGHELVFTAPAHDLIVQRTRWNGHREIEIISATASNVSTVLCRFDGKRYAAVRGNPGRPRVSRAGGRPFRGFDLHSITRISGGPSLAFSRAGSDVLETASESFRCANIPAPALRKVLFSPMTSFTPCPETSFTLQRVRSTRRGGKSDGLENDGCARAEGAVCGGGRAEGADV
jgi:hypothetical protein